MNNKPAYCLHPLHFPVQLNALAKYTLHTKPYYNWMTLWRVNSPTGIVATTIHQRSDLSSLRTVRWGKVWIHEVYPRWQKKLYPRSIYVNTEEMNLQINVSYTELVTQQPISSIHWLGEQCPANLHWFGHRELWIMCIQLYTMTQNSLHVLFVTRKQLNHTKVPCQPTHPPSTHPSTFHPLIFFPPSAYL